MQHANICSDEIVVLLLLEIAWGCLFIQQLILSTDIQRCESAAFYCHRTLPGSDILVCVSQVCNCEADVKRALQAWSEYRTSGKQPIEQYQKSTPAKRNLATMWGQHASSAAEATMRTAEAGGSKACRDHAPASSSLDVRASGQAAGSAVTQAAGVSRSLLPLSEHLERGSNSIGQAIFSSPEPGSGVQASETMHKSSSVTDKHPKGPERKNAAANPGNAFAVLMSRAKQPADTASARGPGQPSTPHQHRRPNPSLEALRQLALDPERYGCLIQPNKPRNRAITIVAFRPAVAAVTT